MADVLIPHAKLTQFAAQCLEKLGVSKPDAAVVAETLVASNLRGVDSHGVVRLPHYANRLRNGTVKARPNITVKRTGAATAVVEGDAGLGQLIGVKAMNEAIALAKEAGIGAVGGRNSSHCGALAWFVEMATREGMVGIAMTHSDPIMVPPGMKKKFIGSNPLAFGAPGQNEPPIVVDMATTHVALGKVIVAQQEKKSIPTDWGVDDQGLATTDPNKVVGLASAGGPKGYALAIMIEIFCAHLLGHPFGTHMVRMYQDLDKPRNLGLYMIAVDISKFTDLKTFRGQIDLLIRETHQQDAVDPTRPPLVPGEPERRTLEKRLQGGVPIGEGVCADLNKLAAELGIAGL